MVNRTKALAQIDKQLFNNKLIKSPITLAGINAIIDEWESSHPDGDLRWLAYILGTAHHETDHLMQPINEYGYGAKKPYGKQIKEDGTHYSDTDQLFYGRGFVQLTWYENYAKAGAAFGLDLLHHPNLALDTDVAAKIIVTGMVEGWFTGRRLSQYFNGKTSGWTPARAIINGSDMAVKISEYAQKYFMALTAE